ncbi:MAG: flagellar brake protein [Proteobacteria bacterium]|nr:flagellar brake protein [Pseudomonadota bacterium]MBU1742364.1 flagellar brake protein [Pseudomonadota bacterium]
MDDTVLLPSRGALPALPPGLKIFLERNVAGQELRTSVGLVGVKEGQFLITERPVFFRGNLFSAVGCDCVVRFLHQGVMYGFITEVLHIQHHPCPLVYLAYPELVEKVNLRHEERYPVKVRSMVFYQDVDEFKSVPGMMIDLSCSGCRVGCPLFIDTDERLELSFRLDDEPASDRLPAIVRHYCRNAAGVFEYGIMFSQQEPTVRAYLGRLESQVRITAPIPAPRNVPDAMSPPEAPVATS